MSTTRIYVDNQFGNKKALLVFEQFFLTKGPPSYHYDASGERE
jgi:hypothetical protein